MYLIIELQVLSERLILVYQFFPPYNLGKGLANLAALDLESTMDGRPSNPCRWDVTGHSLALMLVEAVGFACLTLIIDSSSWLPSWLSFTAHSTSKPSMYLGKELYLASNVTMMSMIRLVNLIWH